jgi:hypothetical protein
MGMFDEIRWDAALPEGHPAEDRIFQTKSLDPCLEHYLVTPEGRLLLVGNGWRDDELEHAQRLGGVDVEFHGDMRLWSVKSHREYLTRFTHGTLEWIRPLADGEPWCSVAVARMKWARLHPTTDVPAEPQADTREEVHGA